MAFISDFAPRLRKISPHFVADPDPRHGSMFRIHRDTRFSKDKSPYKTHASAHFRHGVGKDVHGPGFYLHLEPKSVFIGVGIWHPPPPTLLKLRTHLVEAPGEWTKALKHKAFEGYALRGESLKRPPKGFDKEHPLVADLCRKDFIGVFNFRESRREATQSQSSGGHDSDVLGRDPFPNLECVPEELRRSVLKRCVDLLDVFAT